MLKLNVSIRTRILVTLDLVNYVDPTRHWHLGFSENAPKKRKYPEWHLCKVKYFHVKGSEVNLFAGYLHPFKYERMQMAKNKKHRAKKACILTTCCCDTKLS